MAYEELGRYRGKDNIITMLCDDECHCENIVQVFWAWVMLNLLDPQFLFLLLG